LARGARQFVVQLALETMSMLELYVFSFTPTTNIGASADGADIMIFLAPAYIVEKDKLKLRFEGGKSKAKENRIEKKLNAQVSEYSNLQMR